MAPVKTFRRFLANDDGIFCAFRYFATVRLANVMASCASLSTIASSLIGLRGSSASTNFFILYFIEVADVSIKLDLIIPVLSQKLYY